MRAHWTAWYRPCVVLLMTWDRGRDLEGMERRTHPRYACDVPVLYRLLGPPSTGRVRNLSEGGAMVELQYPAGTPLGLLLLVGDRPLSADAEVVWSEESPGPAVPSHRYSLRFTGFGPQDQLSLERLLAAADQITPWLLSRISVVSESVS